MSGKTLNDAGAFLFDIDGCLLLSETAGGGRAKVFDGAAELLHTLRDRGKPVLCCTNGSRRTPAQYCEWLDDLGLAVAGEEMLTPPVVAAGALAAANPGGSIYAIGSEGLTTPLLERGLKVVATDQATSAETVIVSGVASVSAIELDAACKAVLAGASLYVTAASPWFASSHGRSLGVAAAIGAAITHITNIESETFGKPSPLVMEVAAERAGVPADDFVVVGDDIIAEVGMGRAANALTVLVLSGITSPEDLEAAAQGERPDIVLGEVGELRRKLQVPA